MDSQRFDSDPFGMLLGKLPALNVDIPSNPAEERSIQASVSQELDYFEKIVFSFDMDKGPTNASGGSGDDSKDGNEGNSRQSRSVASTSSSNSQADSYFSQIDPRLLDALYTSVNNRANQSQPTGAPTTTHVPSMTPPFDPYIIAHAAALSALASAPQQFQQFPGLQGDNRDPAAFMRAMYSSVTPALTSTGHAQSGPSASGSQSYPWLPPTGLPTLSQLQSVSTQGQAASSRVSRSASTSSSRDVRTRPEAGPSQPTRGRRQSLPAPRTPVTPVGEEEGDQPFDESAIIEDKRRRNTAASARFRIKKKHKSVALERTVSELEGRADVLEKEAVELRRENGWLKEMLVLKGRNVRAAREAAAALTSRHEEDEKDDDDKDVSGNDGENEGGK